MFLVETLSRALGAHGSDTSTETELLECLQLEDDIIMFETSTEFPGLQLQKLRTEVEKDEGMLKLQDVIEEGWLGRKAYLPTEVQYFYSIHD